MTTKSLLIFIGLAIIFHTADAQYSIKGRVSDEKQHPLELVHISLLQNDSMMWQTMTDSLGKFQFDDIATGLYNITLEYWDKTKTQSLSVTDSDLTLNIAFDSITQYLSGVTVEGKKPVFERKTDRFVFHIANSPLVAGNNLWEVLKKTPLVQTKETGELNIMGMQNATVYINDKKLNLSGADLMNYLSAIPSDNIQRIEVITLPPGKYDAGGGAVINIVIRRSDEEGLTGSITLSDQQAKYNSPSANLTLHYRHKKYSQLFEASWSGGKGYSIFDNTTNYLDNPHYIQEHIHTTNIYNPQQSVYLSGQSDYQVNNRNKIGMVYSYNYFHNKLSSVSTDNIIQKDHGDTLNTIFNNRSENYRTGHFLTVNANYIYNNPNDTVARRNLEVNADALYFNQPGNTSFYTTPEAASAPSYANRTEGRQEIANYSLKIDYSQIIFKSITLETGAKYSYTHINNPFNFYLWNAGWYLDHSNTNHFIYDEGIAAVYVTMQKQLSPKLSVQLGARAEYTHIKMQQEIGNQINRQNYPRVFPAGYINYIINDNNTINLACKTDFERPSYSDLNPFRLYLSPRIYTEGNPFLQPSNSVGAEFTYTFKGRYIFLIQDYRNNNLFQQLSFLRNDTTFVYSRQNYGSSNGLTFAAVINQSVINNKWTASFTGALQYFTQNIKTDNNPYHTKNYIGYVMLQQDFSNIFNTKTDGSLSVYYQTKSVFANVTMSAHSGVDIGLSRNFDKPGIKVALYANDIFNGRRKKYITSSKQFDNINFPNYYERSLRLSISKRFGSAKIKNTEKHETGNSDAANRTR